jgi:hypothetical protein
MILVLHTYNFPMQLLCRLRQAQQPNLASFPKNDENLQLAFEGLSTDFCIHSYSQ